MCNECANENGCKDKKRVLVAKAELAAISKKPKMQNMPECLTIEIICKRYSQKLQECFV